jgi:hypothetical protein
LTIHVNQTGKKGGEDLRGSLIRYGSDAHGIGLSSSVVLASWSLSNCLIWLPTGLGKLGKKPPTFPQFHSPDDYS